MWIYFSSPKLLAYFHLFCRQIHLVNFLFFLLIFIYLQIYFEGQSNSIQPNSRILIENPWRTKTVRKINYFVGDSYYGPKIYFQTDFNEGKSAASFCHLVVARVTNMFCNFYLVKIHKIANNSTTIKAREKNKYRFGILRNFDVYLTKFLKKSNFTL